MIKKTYITIWATSEKMAEHRPPKFSPIKNRGGTGRVISINQFKKARFQSFKAGNVVAFFICPILILLFSVEICAPAVIRGVTTALGLLQSPMPRK